MASVEVGQTGKGGRMCTRIGQVGFVKVLRRRAAQATQGRAEIVAQICAIVRSGEENSGVVELRAPLRREAPWLFGAGGISALIRRRFVFHFRLVCGGTLQRSCSDRQHTPHDSRSRYPHLGGSGFVRAHVAQGRFVGDLARNFLRRSGADRNYRTGQG